MSASRLCPGALEDEPRASCISVLAALQEGGPKASKSRHMQSMMQSIPCGLEKVHVSSEQGNRHVLPVLYRRSRG